MVISVPGSKQTGEPAFDPNQPKVEEEKPKYEPLTLKVGRINRKGVLRLRFN